MLTSSKMDRVPFSRHRSMSPARYPSSGMHDPEFTLIGSVMAQAIWPGFSSKGRNRGFSLMC